MVAIRTNFLCSWYHMYQLYSLRLFQHSCYSSSDTGQFHLFIFRMTSHDYKSYTKPRLRIYVMRTDLPRYSIMHPVFNRQTEKLKSFQKSVYAELITLTIPSYSSELFVFCLEQFL